MIHTACRHRKMQAAALLISMIGLSGTATAQRQHHGQGERSDSAQDASTCYDETASDEIRLWPSRAPGATGDDPCRDIPFVRVFRADGAPAAAAQAAILVIPGGGYDRLSDTKEQAPIGEYFSKNLRLTTFILYYRLVQADGLYRYPVPMWDGQRALKVIRHLAPHYGIDPNKVGAFGFSAGGHLASTLALHSATDFNLPVRDDVDSITGRVDFLGLGYPVISMEPDAFASSNSLAHLLFGYQGPELSHLERYLSGQDNVRRDMPPVFLFESMDDQRISAQNSVLFAQALRAANISADVHLFPHGQHGAGLAVGISGEEMWPEFFRQWLIKMHLVD